MPATIVPNILKQKDPNTGEYLEINGVSGRGITNIEKTGTSGSTDTYTITYSDGTTFQYALVNEANGEAYGVGKRNGTDVPSTDPAYHNNAKYYAEQAQRYAGGYINLYIDNSGHLIFEHTPSADIDFELENGRLIAIWP